PATQNAADRDAFTAILDDPTVGDWWQVPDVAADVAELLADPELAIWLIEEAGAIVGIVMAGEETDPMYRHASIDIAIVASGQGLGLGRETVRTVAHWLVNARNHHRLVIDPSAANARAIRAYESVGFRPVGTLRAYERWRDGSWHDGLLMDLLADDLIDD
ncbi:MAG: GNAT family N-acetyltransferase, partial [Chloroflexota bacterium]|nr:GNAT family N-acetyltransferase [Chloroflexota bacterium]